MKTYENRQKLLALLLMLAMPTIIFSQGGLIGSWKYVYQGGEMIMEINIRQDSGMITELMYDGTLYATGLCE